MSAAAPHLEAGRAARAAGDREAALRHFLAATEADAADHAARTEAAQLLFDAGDLDRAAAFCQAVLAAAASHRAHVLLGHVARQRGQHELALAHYRSALDLKPEDPWAGVDVAGELLRLGRNEEAEHLLRRLTGIQPAAANAHYRLGAILAGRGDREAALSHFLQAVAAEPGQGWARVEAAGLLLALGRLDEAEAMAAAVPQAHPMAAQARRRLVEIARRRGGTEAGLAQLRAALDLAPGDAALRAEVSAALLDLARPEDAARLLLEGGALADAPPDLLRRLGMDARRRGDRAQALRFFEALAGKTPPRHDAAVEAAVELLVLGRAQDAAGPLEAVVAAEATNARAWHLLGLARRRCVGHDAALDAFRRAADLEPDKATHLVEIAAEQAALGLVAEADASLARALELEPASLPARLRTAERRIAQGRFADALDLARAARDDAPASLWAWLLEAKAVEKLEGPEAALHLLGGARAALGPEPGLERARLRLFADHGRHAEARDLAAAATARDFGGDAELCFAVAQFHLSVGEHDAASALGAHPLLRSSRKDAWVLAALAEARGEVAVAAGHLERVAEANPAEAMAWHDLARVRMLDLQLDGVRQALGRHVALTRGGGAGPRKSTNVSQTFLGALLNEYRLEPDHIAALRAMPAAPEERVARLMPLLRANGHSTAAAIALLLALRRAGRLGGVAADGAPPGAIPRQVIRCAAPGEAAEEGGVGATWRRMNPGHALRSFSAAEADAWIAATMPRDVLVAFRRSWDRERKTDLFKLAILAQEGGVFVREEARCIAPLAGLLAGGATLVSFQDEHGAFGSWLLAAAPGHPVILRALRDATAAVNGGHNDMGWLSTGPGLLTRAFAACLAEAGEAEAAAMLGRTRLLTVADQRRHVGLSAMPRLVSQGTGRG